MTSEALTDEELQERIRLAPGRLIATRIKRARTTKIDDETGKALSHDKLGQLCGGVSRQHLIRLEQAQHRPRAVMLRRISEATGRSVDWFLDPSIDPSPFPGEHELAA